ncbi:MAG: hypothetical protein AB1646_13315 [Thermodesulfobacteriota bacterium]
MKTRLGQCVCAALVFGLLLGCAPAIKSAKPDAPETAAPERRADAPPKKTVPQPSTPGSGELVKPTYDPPPAPPQDKEQDNPPIFGQEEVRDSAKLFMENLPHMIHAKICYSRYAGGWYLYEYRKKNSKIFVHQYQYDPRTKEWQITPRVDPVPKERLDLDLKFKMDDETCEILK